MTLTFTEIQEISPRTNEVRFNGSVIGKVAPHIGGTKGWHAVINGKFGVLDIIQGFGDTMESAVRDAFHSGTRERVDGLREIHKRASQLGIELPPTND